MKEQYRALPSKVSTLRHNMNEFLTKKMRSAGWQKISPSHGGIIYALLNNQVLNMKEIAEKVKRDPSTVTTLVNKLEQLGYAEFEKNPDDLRSKQVRLSDKGRDLCSVFQQISVSLTDTLLEGISDNEIEEFMRTMEKMNSNIMNSMGK